MVWGRLLRAFLLAGLAVSATSCTEMPTSNFGGYEDLDVSLAESDGAQMREPLAVAIVDGGIDTNHPSVSDRVTKKWSADGLVDEPPSPHATQVAGLVAGSPFEEFPGGLAPTATIFDARAVSSTGTGEIVDVAAAVSWATAAEADIILISLGTERDDPALRRSIKGATERGIVVIASTGNGFGGFDQYPSSYSGVLGITAHGRNGRLLSSANPRDADFSAPGESIVAPTTQRGTTVLSGTSIAAAVAAGVIAACWEPTKLLEYSLEGTRDWPAPVVANGNSPIPSLICQPDQDQELR